MPMRKDQRIAEKAAQGMVRQGLTPSKENRSPIAISQSPAIGSESRTVRRQVDTDFNVVIAPPVQRTLAVARSGMPKRSVETTWLPHSENGGAEAGRMI